MQSDSHKQESVFCSFLRNMNNIRKTWKGINSLITNNKKDLRPIFSLKDPETNELILKSRYH